MLQQTDTCRISNLLKEMEWLAVGRSWPRGLAQFRGRPTLFSTGLLEEEKGRSLAYIHHARPLCGEKASR